MENVILEKFTFNLLARNQLCNKLGKFFVCATAVSREFDETRQVGSLKKSSKEACRELFCQRENVI